MTASVRNAGQDLVPLAPAARLTPGRPSASALWRWCRKGVKTRSGDRLRLEHVRVGGRVFTCADWIADFGKRLAAADVAHFDAKAAAPLPPRDPAYGPPSGRGGRVVVTDSRTAEIERELEEEGL